MRLALRRRDPARLVALLGVLLLLGAGPAARAADEIGIYWDEALTQTDIVQPDVFVPLTGYLVIRDPGVGGGILGWECRVAVDGPGTLTNWSLAGQAINAATPPDFAVGLAAPLPPGSSTAVATFTAFVTGPGPVEISLGPIYFASLPGRMAYLGGDAPGDLQPLVTTTGEPVVATINSDSPVGELETRIVRFGTVTIGQSVTRWVGISNVGGGVLPLDISLVCADPQFQLSRTGAVAVAAGQTFSLGITFTPSGPGPHVCAVSLGTGLPQIDVAGSGRDLVSSWTEPVDIDFGTLEVGSITTGSTSLRNTGETVLALDVAWDGPHDPFAITSGGGVLNLQPGLIRSVQVRFAPVQPGEWTSRIVFGDGLPDALVHGVAVWSTPDYEILPSHVVFPATEPGSGRVQVIRIVNRGVGSFEVVPAIVPDTAPFAVGRDGETLVVPPGTELALIVNFNPVVDGYFTADLDLGPYLPAVSLAGTGGPVIESCAVTPDTLAISGVAIGQTAYGTVTVENLGTVPLALAPFIDNPAFAVVGTPPAEVAPGAAAPLQIAYTANSIYDDEGVLALGPAACSGVVLRGRPDVGIPLGTNQLGLYFDPGFTAAERAAEVPPFTVPVYLALRNPTDTSGVAGWECLVVVRGEALFTDVVLAGNAINAGDPVNGYEYVVGIGLAPLPYLATGTLLATFDLLVTDVDPTNVALELRPIQQPSLPGFMSWLPWNDQSALTPMVTTTGVPEVARITDGDPVAVALPTPRAVPAAGGVDLEWTVRLDDVDGFHVFRRLPGAAATRVTETLLPADGAVIRYRDDAPPPAGGTAWYSYAAWRDGRELARSAEVEVTSAGTPVARTALLANVPNPFNPETRIRYALAADGPVRVAVFDVTGRLVRTLVDGRRSAGEQDVTWSGRDDTGRAVASGAYYVRLETAAGVDHRKIMLLK
ncbi:choice-of-anchor D domain-containing protein [bacterium]|nr:choice-of-anchor D domain-containing protein [bacterium]